MPLFLIGGPMVLGLVAVIFGFLMARAALRSRRETSAAAGGAVFLLVFGGVMQAVGVLFFLIGGFFLFALLRA